VARGWFHTQPLKEFSADQYQTNNAEFDYNADATAIVKMREAGLYLAATPDFYFEGKFAPGKKNKQTMAIQPLYSYFGRPISVNSINSDARRNILLSFGFADASSKTDFSKGAGTTVVIGQMMAGTEKEFHSPGNYTEIKNASGSTVQIMRNSYESDWFSLKLTEEMSPLNLQVLVSETRSANAFLKLVGEVFGDVKENLTTEVQNRLVPSKIEELETAAKTENEKLVAGYYTAYAAAGEKLLACSAASTPSPQKALEARVAMQNLIAVGKASSLPTIFSATDVSSITLDPQVSDSGACTGLLSKL